MRDSDDPLLQALLENCYLWAEEAKWFADGKTKKYHQSSTLFDTVAISLAIRNEFCKMKTLPVRLTNEGMTVINPQAKKMQVATEWKDFRTFEDWLVERLTKPKKE